MQYTQTEELIVMLNTVSFHSNAGSKKKLIEFSVFTSARNRILDQCSPLQFDKSKGVFSVRVVKKVVMKVLLFGL